VASRNSTLRLPDAARFPGGPTLLLGGGLAILGLVAASSLLLRDAPASYVLLGVCAAATVPVLVWGVVTGRLLEPLPLLAATCAVMFVLRPLQLIVDWLDLYSYFFPKDPVDSLVLLEGQEVAFFVGRRLEEPIETALARALGACALFLLMALLGYRLVFGRRLAARFARLAERRPAINVRAAVGISLVIGLAAQATIIARAGGPAASLESAAGQNALSDSFVLYVLSGFGLAALLIWVAWRQPRGRLEWAALLFSVAAVCGGWIVAGSRARVFITLLALALVVHFVRRRWRPREMAAAIVVLLAFGSSFVVFRQVADHGSLGDAATAARDHVLDVRVIVNDISYFDHVLYATTIYGNSRPHEYGEFLLNGARSYLPGKIDPNKPEGGDIVFRKAVWGNQFGAGRPPTAVGDFYIDFGFPGVAVGGLLIGIAARTLLGLLRGGPAGREYRVAVYAILVLVLYEFVVGTFSIALGFALTLLLPFLVAVHGLGRVRW
jgi:oligosaccharide repeat unit polymerase